MKLDLPHIPDWALKIFLALALIGVGACWFGVCVGLAYLIRHLHWVP